MKRYAIAITLISSSLLLSAAGAFAHHSFAAQYDRNKPVKFTGKVTKVEWMNPHVYFYVDVQDPGTGKVTNFACEAGAPNGLYRNGWRKDTLKAGDGVIVEGWLAKDGSDTVNAGNITLNGKRIFAGSSGDDGSPAQRR